MNAKENKDILKEIASGKYRGAYLIYARKSTDEPENQKNSIAYQKAETVRFAQREHLPIAGVTLPGFCTDGVISERHSGFHERLDLTFGKGNTVQYRIERPKFHQLVSFLAKGHFKGVVFLCWDRASRNKGDDTILRKLMKAGVDVRFALAQYDQTSAGELHMDIDGMFAEHHSRVTREKVTLTIQESRAKGLCTHKAPVGYLNEGSMERKPLDSERAPIIRALFEKADRTSWSLSDLRRFAIEQGFTMPPMRRKRTRDEMLADEEQDGRRDMEKIARLPTVTNIHVILTNPFYTGKVRGNGGQWVTSASHQALVSQALFERVQAKLASRRTSVHYDKKLDQPFRGLLRCGCGRVYTPYEQKGHTYFGARCDRSCPNGRKSVNLAFVCDAVGSILSGLAFTDEEVARVCAAADARATGLEQRQVGAREAAERRLRKLRENLVYLTDNRLTLLRTGAYTPEALAADEARITRELEQLEAEPTDAGVKLREATAEVINLSELLKTAQPAYELAEPTEKEAYARVVFSELSLFENTLNYQCRNGFRPFERQSFDDSALSCWLSELVAHQGAIQYALDELSGLAGEPS